MEETTRERLAEAGYTWAAAVLMFAGLAALGGLLMGLGWIFGVLL